MERRFVVVSGLPGSGKSTLAHAVAPLIGLPVLDKDDILELLFAEKGVGDAAWRRALSRESDRILEAEARDSTGAILVSHWRAPGMTAGSGTPTDWITGLGAAVVTLHCACPVEVACARFVQRARHPGHLDQARSAAQVLASLQDIAGLERVRIGPCIEVDTSAAPEPGDVLRHLRAAFELCRRSK